MSLVEKETTSYLTVLGSTGDFRMTVPEGTEGATLREYETSDGKKGSKWEKVYRSAQGFITGIEFFEGEYGKNLVITLSDYGEEPIKISLGTSTNFGEDVLKKLPAVDLTKYVTLTPYAFEADGKPRKGVTIMQGDTKVMSHYYDPEKKKAVNGMPEPEGDTKKFGSDDWKMHFMKVRKFMIGEVEKNVAPNVLKELPEKPEPEEVPFE